MPPRSKIFGLPNAVRDELNARLVGSGFGGYVQLKEWLEGQGYSLSIGSLHRYGSTLQADFETAMDDVRRTQELARALVANQQEDRGELMEAAEKIAQDGLIRLQLALRQLDDDPEAMARLLPRITRAIADLNRAGISRNKWQDELRGKLDGKFKRLESEAESSSGPRRLDAETLRVVRQEIYGIM